MRFSDTNYQRITGYSRFRQEGVALFVGLVFLVILTLVALVAMRGTLLEMRMTTATARHEMAFEASEASRTITEALIQSHIVNRGWPVTWGGTVPNAVFNVDATFANRSSWSSLLNPTTTSGQGIQKCGGALVIFFIASTCPTPVAGYNYAPSGWQPAAIFKTCASGGTGGSSPCPAAQIVTNTVSIIRDGLTLNKGSGAAQSQGYSSVGVGSSKGGSSILFQVRSDSTIGAGNGEAVTISQYKLSVSN